MKIWRHDVIWRHLTSFWHLSGLPPVKSGCMTSSDSNILVQFYYMLKVQCFSFHLRGKSLFLDKDSQNYRVLLFCKKFPWFWLIFADLGSKFDDVITFLNFFRHFLAELIKLNIFAKNYENCTFPSENMRVVQICTTPPKMGVSETPPKIGLRWLD